MKKWSVAQTDILQQNKLGSELEISPIVAQLLLNRGITDTDKAKTFLSGSMSELYNPFLLEGMHEAVMRIKKAINNEEKILIHGDYDVDGITSVAVLMFTLRSLGIEPVYYIPDRLTQGYGLSSGGVREAIDTGARVVITVDCGITSSEEVKALNEHNIDVIITDHHELSKDLPPAYAIVNPHRKDCYYSDKDLSGVSIAFKLCDALCSEFNSKEAWKHLDLVSLGTISDVAPLLGENRILVKEGLKLFKTDKLNKGVRALIEVGGLKDREIGSFEIGYMLGPRINAAGRLGSARTAVELLLTDDKEKALLLAKGLNDANRARQKIGASTLKEALSKVDKYINLKHHKVIVLHNEGWHKGVIGIVASRISDRFYRPTILISTKDGVGRGSGRSIESFHLYDALIGCEGLLKEYGGHQYACGLTILEENLEKFTEMINEIANTVLTADDLIPHLDIDMEIPLASLDHDVIDQINRLQPFGEENPEPVFCSRNLRLARPVRVLKGAHIKLYIRDGVKVFEAIGFGLAKNSDIDELLKKSPELAIAYTVSINTWQGMDTIQLKIKDIQPS